MRLQEAIKDRKNYSEFRSMRVADIMTEKPVTVTLNTDVEAAWELMEDNHFRHLPVVDKNGDIQGVISLRDLQRYESFIRREQTKASLKGTNRTVKIRELMTKSPETISPEASIFEAATVILENKIGCLPVTDGEEVVGILTETDFVKLVMLQMEG